METPTNPGRFTLPFGAVYVLPMVMSSTFLRGRSGTSWRRRVERTLRFLLSPGFLGSPRSPSAFSSACALSISWSMAATAASLPAATASARTSVRSASCPKAARCCAVGSAVSTRGSCSKCQPSRAWCIRSRRAFSAHAGHTADCVAPHGIGMTIVSPVFVSSRLTATGRRQAPRSSAAFSAICSSTGGTIFATGAGVDFASLMRPHHLRWSAERVPGGRSALLAGCRRRSGMRREHG